MDGPEWMPGRMDGEASVSRGRLALGHFSPQSAQATGGGKNLWRPIALALQLMPHRMSPSWSGQKLPTGERGRRLPVLQEEYSQRYPCRWREDFRLTTVGTEVRLVEATIQAYLLPMT